MRFLLDQDVYFKTVKLLRDLNHDVVTAKELSMSRSDDRTLLLKAKETNRIFVTRDKDFGALVFLNHIKNGVILLRMTYRTIDEVHFQLKFILDTYKEIELKKLFTTIEADRHRMRKI